MKEFPVYQFWLTYIGPKSYDYSKIEQPIPSDWTDYIIDTAELDIVNNDPYSVSVMRERTHYRRVNLRNLNLNLNKSRGSTNLAY